MLLLLVGCVGTKDAPPTHDSGGADTAGRGDSGCDGAEGRTYADADGDGWGDDAIYADGCPPDGYVATAGDCDDADASVHPGADEVCDDIDQDCDGASDPPPTWYYDEDGDGHGDPADAWADCTQLPHFVAAGDDCDDTDPTVAPGAVETCDGRDEDCDGVVPADEADADGDGQSTCEGDCDDADAALWIGAVERCDDAVDNDCDGVTDDDCPACTTVVTAPASIQDAIDAAADGDVVCVAGGTYVESLDFSGKDLTLLGVGTGLAFLDGGGVDRVVTFQSGEGPGAVLSGFTIQGGYADLGDGGGILVASSSPTLVDLVVSGNESTGYPALMGGGIFVDGGAPTLTNLVVRDNRSYAASEYHYGLGGGVALRGSDAVLDSVVMTGNAAGASGSGLYLEDSTAAIFASDISDNGAVQRGGGGVYVVRGAPTFENVRVSGNHAVEEYGVTYGGGLWLDETDAAFTNVAIVDNDTFGVSSSHGGGILIDGGAPTFVNVVIQGNTSDDAGGGVYLRGGIPTFAYSDLYGNGPDDLSGFTDPTGTDGNVSVDPAFADDALHLRATSPLVDAGDPTILDPDGSPSDIGRFGGPGADAIDLDGDGWPSWWLPGPYDAATSPAFDCDDDDAATYPGSGC